MDKKLLDTDCAGYGPEPQTLPDHEEFWCVPGQHVWSRPWQIGGGQHEWRRTCPDHDSASNAQVRP